MDISVAAIICAAGSSNRMGGAKKEYLHLGSSTRKNLTVLGAAVSAFASHPKINQLIITLPPDSVNANAFLPAELHDRVLYCFGGPSRRSSVHNALLFLESLDSNTSHVLIHDGARPWVKQDLIERIINAAVKHGAAIPALPLLETPKELERSVDFMSGEEVFIKRHLRRAGLCSAQTPQGFAFPEILLAHRMAAEKEMREGKIFTDDAEVWGDFSGSVAVIPGDPENRKITYPGDLCRG